MKKAIVYFLCGVGLFALFLFTFSVVVGVLVGQDWESTGERVGVVKVEGFIGDASDPVTALRKFRKDDDVKAVVVHVVTPGGVVAPSQEIHDELKRTAEQKPVICSFGAVAASGGYYLSVPATRIVANPGTVTGSIGVILQFHDYQILFDKIGLRTGVVKSGPYKDTGSPFRDMTEQERALMQTLVDDIYNQFVEAVAAGRGMERAEVEQLADGRIYSGRQALDAGLVDQLGGFWDAVELAADLGGIEGEIRLERWERPEPGLLRVLFGDQAGALDLVDPVTAPPLRYVLPGW